MNFTKFRFSLLIFFISATAFAEKKEMFVDDRYDARTKAPRSMSAEYYDKIDASKSLWQMSFDEWFYGPHLTANWGGARSALEANGFIMDLSYTGTFAGNPVGGASRGIASANSFNLGFAVELEKLTGLGALKGWTFENSWTYRFGDTLSKNRVKDEFGVQQNYGSQDWMLHNFSLAYASDFNDESLHFLFKFGRIDAGDNFLTKPIYWLYMNNAIDGNPKGVFLQSKFSSAPGGTWGAFTEIYAKEGYYFRAGVYQINSDKQDDPSKHGLAWSFTESIGVNANFEIGWDINHDTSGKNPGNISLGAVLDWYTVPHLDNPNEHSYFNSSYYLQADYMIWNLGLPDRSKASTIRRSHPKNSYRDLRGLILWGTVIYDPYEELAKMPLFVNGGLVFNAPFLSRPDDSLAFGVAYGKYSDKLTTNQRGSYELMLELTYKFQINRFIFIQPDIQYIINVSGGEYPDALVLGAQFGVSF